MSQRLRVNNSILVFSLPLEERPWNGQAHLVTEHFRLGRQPPPNPPSDSVDGMYYIQCRKQQGFHILRLSDPADGFQFYRMFQKELYKF
jgi:hypothetical protein